MTASDRKPGILFGPDRKIRLLWRAVIFYVLADWLLPLALNPAFGFIARTLHVADGLTPANVAIWEIEGFVIAVCGRISHRVRLHAVICDRYPKRRASSAGKPAGCQFQRTLLADRRRARHRGEFPHVPGDCVGLALYLVALPAAP